MSRRIAAKITGVSGYVPPRVMSNADMEKLVDTSDAWIHERTGIRERHVADKGMAASDLATEAARQVLASRNVPASDIDLIVVASVTPDMMFPATACLVQNNLGATHAWGFDLSAVCSGFLYALTVGAQFVGAGTQKRALIIGSDVMTSILDYQDRATCVLFGDGAGAVLLEPTESGEEGILETPRPFPWPLLGLEILRQFQQTVATTDCHKGTCTPPCGQGFVPLCETGDTVVERWFCPEGCGLEDCKSAAVDYTLACNKRGKAYYGSCSQYGGIGGNLPFCDCCKSSK